MRAASGAVLLLLAAIAAPSAARARGAALIDPDVLEALLPAVVNISIWKVDDPAGSAAAAGRMPRRVQAFGSGFIIDPTGIIVTNQHVIQGAEEITVTFHDNSRATATVMGVGGGVDIALIKVDVDHTLPVLSFGNSDALRIGDPVVAIGNPLGIGMSASSGIVSALNRDIKDSPYDDFIQTDAAINHGNSGGPLVNMRGEVVGVDTALYSDVDNGGSIGLGFAITSKDTVFLVNLLLTYGRADAGWIGVELQDITPDIADGLGMTQPHGAIVTGVDDNSPAQEAGLQAGDVLLRVNGAEATDSRAYMRAIATESVGDYIPFDVWRNGREKQLLITIAEWPGDNMSGIVPTANQAGATSARPPDFGVKLAAVTEDAIRQYQLQPGQQGVLVAAVQDGSPASDRGLAPGDVILEAQRTLVSSPDQVRQVAKQARLDKHRFLLLLVQQQNGRRWISMPLEPIK